MKSLKKLIAFAVSFALVFGAMAVGFAATTPFTDVKDDAPYASAVARLVALDITKGVGDGKFGVDQPVTRAQMVTFVNRMLGYEGLAEMAKAEKSVFKDVPQNHWAVGHINLAYQMGIAKGVGDGKFDPNGQLTYAQALAFVLRALGYQDLSWPYGVLAKAQDIGLTAGINLAYNQVMLRGDLALVLDRALNTPMVKYVDGKETSGELLVSKIATAADYTVIATHAQDSTVPEGKVAVLDKDGKLVTISAGAVDFTKYLGKKVTVYSVKYGDPVYVAEKDNDVVKFTEGENSVGTTVYKDDTNNTPIVVKDPAYVLYNGYLTKLSNAVIYKGADVTVINGNYVIANNSFERSTVVLTDVQSGDKYINRDSNYELKGTITVTGAVSKVTDIKANDYIYYGKQYNVKGEVVGTVIYVVRNHVSGTVTEVAQQGSVYKASIDGTSYKVATETLWNTLRDNVGKKVTVILDKYNVIAGIASTPVAKVANYAIFKEISNPFTAWFAKVKLVLTDGTEKVFDAVYNDVYNKFAGLNAGDVVTYSVNANGALTDIASAGAKNFTGGQYKVATNTLTVSGTVYYFNGNTILLNKVNGEYKPLKLADLKDATVNGWIVADEYNIAQIVVFDNAQFVTPTEATAYAYIKGVATVYSKDGTTFYRITVLENGVEKVYDATSTVTIANDLKDTNGTLKANQPVKLTIKDGKVTAIESPISVGPVTLTTIDQANLRVVDNTKKGYLLDPNFIVVDTNGNLKGLGDIKSDTQVELYLNDIGKVFVIKITQ